MLTSMQRAFAIFSATLLLLLAVMLPAQAQEGPTVQGLFFYSPSCGHCHVVINDHLPGIFDQYGGEPDVRFDENDPDPAFVLLTNGTLELLMINTTLDAGAEIYGHASVQYDVPAEMMGVPRLVMGDEFFVGSGDIPAALPGLIEEGLAAGGTDWPDLPGVDAALAAVPDAIVVPDSTTATTSPDSAPTTILPSQGGEETTTSTNVADPFPDVGGTPGVSEVIGEPLNTIGEKFRNDLAGNTLAVIVLLGMIVSLALVVVSVRRERFGSPPDWLVPVLAAAGVVVAVYLTYLETSGSEAICGPIGNCGAVQDSKFALLFGLIHVGLVGLISYAVVVGAWLASRLMKAPWADWARVGLALGAAGGVAFSVYLTFLEPFVIGATCMWCLSSAIIVTALFWITAGPGWAAWRRLRTG